MKERCPKCNRKPVHCFCPEIVEQHIKTKVSILQHPTESSHPFGTAHFAALGLDNCTIYTAESITFPTQGAFLLYPSEKAVPLEDLKHPIEHLIVLDGTWKKTNKLLFSNPQLKELPHLVLRHPPQGQYTIRKSSKEGMPNTAEAIAYALDKLEGINTETLLRPMFSLINQQLGHLP
jgi:DTW domain-containing protein YfiP